MNINVKTCYQCPFFVSDFDDYAVGYDTLDYCNLARFINLEDNIIDVYNSFEREKLCDYCDNIDYNDSFNNEHSKCDELYIESHNTKPGWCPLKSEEIIITNDLI